MKTDRRGRHGGPNERRDRGREQGRRSPQGGRDTLPPVKGDLLYGRHAVVEALRGRRQPHRLFLAAGIRQEAKVTAIQESAAAASVPSSEVAREVLDQLTGGANHQGVALDASRYPYANVSSASGHMLIALDHLQDPQNLGTLLRTAEACGVGMVLIPTDRAAEVTPSVVNASAGAVEHLAISQVTNMSRTLETLKEAGWWVVGLDSGDDSQDLYAADLPTPTILVVGAEGKGLSPIVRRSCDLVVRLPMRGRIESLNAATAGSVALFELTSRHFK